LIRLNGVQVSGKKIDALKQQTLELHQHFTGMAVEMKVST
jgi:hypothetical protein